MQLLEKRYRKAEVPCRIVLGLIFTVFGLNGFFSLIPIPAPNADAAKFLYALKDTGYLFFLVKGIEVLGGVLLLFSFQIPLALLLLCPIVVNIFLYNTVLDSSGWWMGVLLLVLEVVLILFHWNRYRGIFGEL